MEKKKHDYFISYSSKDEVAAFNLYNALRKEGYSCWIASQNIGTGHYPKAIVKGIKESKSLIIVFSSHSNDSTPVLQELELATNNNLLIIPLRIEDCIPTESMEYYIRINNWFDNFQYQSVSDFKDFTQMLKKTPNPKNSFPKNFVPTNKTNVFFFKSISFIILFFTLILTMYTVQAKVIEQKDEVIEQQYRNINYLNELIKIYQQEIEKNKNNPKILSQANHIKSIAGYKEAIKYFRSDNKNLFYSNYINIIYNGRDSAISISKKLYSLYLCLRPISSNIEILNSKEEYTNNTNLEKGIYDIRISADGYREKRILIELNQDKNLSIELDKLIIDRSK